MSRGLDDDSEYFRNTEGGKVPTRWTAPEALTSRKYTTSSDVWSFGVLLWEIMSKGRLPYSELKVNSQVIAEVSRGRRLPHPVQCPDSVYAIMQQCWAENRRKRITFPMIVVTLNNALAESRPRFGLVSGIN
jgi:Eph receptor A1